MKLAHPNLSALLVDTALEVMADDGEVESAYVHDEAAINCNIVALQVIDSKLESVQLIGAHLSRLVCRDVVLRRCDFSSASLDNGMLVRVEFVNCRLVGTDFSRTNLHDVRFKDCKLDGALFAGADLRRVTFDNCSLEGVDLTRATRYQVES
jgi:uncharacterized protein YjbI with pentapeptide repeats